MIKVIWWIHTHWLLPLTHKEEPPDSPWAGSWRVRRWAKGWFINGHPWILWCGCGDGLENWHEVWHRKCSNCEFIEEIRAWVEEDTEMRDG